MTRPNIRNLFASNAAVGDIGDPDVFTPVSPSYPDRVENQYSLGWFVSGTKIVKQPHQWVNFLYNGVDKNLYSLAFKFNQWSSVIPYKKGAMVSHNLKHFKAISENLNSLPPSLDWEECFSESPLYKNKLDINYSNISSHELRRDNPHQVTKEQVDAYSISEVDASLAISLASINAHKTYKNPHSVSYKHLGVLPKSGGVFTGPVVLHDMVLSRGTIKPLNSAIRFEAFGTRFGVRADTGLNKDSLNVISFNNYEPIKIRNNFKFAERLADIGLPLNGCLNFFADGGTEVLYKGDAFTFTIMAEVISVGVDEAGFNQGLRVSSGFHSVVISGLPNEVYILATVDGEPVLKQVSSTGEVDIIDLFKPSEVIGDVKVWFGSLERGFKSSLRKG